MQKFETVEGVAAPMLRANVDTDLIIRIERLVGTGRTGLGQHAFEQLRAEPDFVLNKPAYRDSPILLAGANFGCGSSREGAVWALMGAGIACVIAPSFGDIFHANCFQNGLLPVVLPEAEIRALARETEDSQGVGRTRVDLARQVVVTPSGREVPFAVDARRREALLEGLDDVALTLKRQAEILAWQARDHAARPWAWNSVAQ
ncbi:MAG: 3-isopropylmalate dehydratase small subunit [Pseudomonadota bacterium]